MSILRYFSPQKIKFPDSRYNKNISIQQFLNSTILFVDGLIESGDIMTHVWKRGIKSLLPKYFHPQKVLLLGLAGGCNAHLINHYFPKANITAVEIDPLMVELGKKYFKLGKVKNLKIIIADATSFIKKLSPNDQFDLIMVDCFIGQKIPKKLEDIEFLKQLKKHARFVLINRLWWQQEKNISSNFFRSIADHFFFTKTHTTSNIVISLV
ncbi:MAG TPA: methyltransferase domain-containing protein [Spirochaetia bacterium]|nr:methyltransferase domain-containing protein [Spirochaetia bacterium]